MKKYLRIMTYNVHKGFAPGNFHFRLPEMKQALVNIAPDILLLQEVVGQHRTKKKRISNWPDENQAHFIAKQCWPYFTYGKQASYGAGDHGNAILSKHRFLSVQNMSFTTHHRASRGLLHSQISLGKPFGFLHVICVHLGLFKRNRHSHILSLKQRILSHVGPTEILVIGGDFNDWRRHDTEAFEEELGLTEVCKSVFGAYAKTYPSIRPTFFNDRLYFRGLRLLEVKVFNAVQWRTLSDHLPLLASFEVG